MTKGSRARDCTTTRQTIVLLVFLHLKSPLPFPFPVTPAMLFLFSGITL
jgi:hypothetical protein